jgi:hypothetical protein
MMNLHVHLIYRKPISKIWQARNDAALGALFHSFPVLHESAKARLIETNGTNASFLPRPVQTGVMANLV